MDHRVAEIVALEEIDRWEVAKLISEEVAAGKSQHELAREIDKSQPHVWRMARVWHLYGWIEPKPHFNTCYRLVRVRGAQARKAA